MNYFSICTLIRIYLFLKPIFSIVKSPACIEKMNIIQVLSFYVLLRRGRGGELSIMPSTISSFKEIERKGRENPAFFGLGLCYYGRKVD